MSEVKRYPTTVLRLQDFEGFNAQFESLLPHMKASEAYKATEAIYFKWFARCKYSSYESFRVIRSAKIKAK